MLQSLLCTFSDRKENLAHWICQLSKHPSTTTNIYTHTCTYIRVSIYIKRKYIQRFWKPDGTELVCCYQTNFVTVFSLTVSPQEIPFSCLILINSLKLSWGLTFYYFTAYLPQELKQTVGNVDVKGTDLSTILHAKLN